MKGINVGTVSGQIQVAYSSSAPQKANSAIDNKILILSATAGGGSITWTCKSSTIDKKFLPSACR